jgi:DUF2934 family protein
MTKQVMNIPKALPRVSESRIQQRVSQRAYEFWLGRAFRHGSPETDWLRANREIRGKAGAVRLRRTAVGLFLMAPPRS